MTFHVEFTESALKDLKSLDISVAAMLHEWILKKLEGCSDPRLHGKSLKGNFSGAWRFRKGDYRIITKIDYDKVIILVSNIGHRSDIYKRRE